MRPLHPLMLHALTGSEEILRKQYATRSQERFICPLSKHNVIYTWCKWWRESSSQENKPEIVCPRETEYDYRIRASDFLMPSYWEGRGKSGFFAGTFHLWAHEKEAWFKIWEKQHKWILNLEGCTFKNSLCLKICSYKSDKTF